MHGCRKSDEAIVAVKAANKAERSAAEPVERRAEAKGNAGQQTRSGLSASYACHRCWPRIRTIGY